MRRLALIVGVVVLAAGCDGPVDELDETAVDAAGTSAETTAAQSPSASEGSTNERVDRAGASEETSPHPGEAERTDPAGEGPSEGSRSEPAQQSTRKTEPGRMPKPQDRSLYPVLDVVDGDTVKVGYRGGVSVRIIGIDTPETVHPSQPDECWGHAASAAAEKLLAGKEVALVFDPTQGRTDFYDRTLAYLEVPGLGDFGLTMIQRGHAAEYTYDSAYRRQSRYRAAESTAKAADMAMWGRCGGPDVPLAEPTPTAEPEPEPARPQAPAGGCASGYDPCVPAYPPDVNCADVDGPVRVTGGDPHGLDADGDGIACES